MPKLAITILIYRALFFSFQAFAEKPTNGFDQPAGQEEFTKFVAPFLDKMEVFSDGDHRGLWHSSERAIEDAEGLEHRLHSPWFWRNGKSVYQLEVAVEHSNKRPTETNWLFTYAEGKPPHFYREDKQEHFKIVVDSAHPNSVTVWCGDKKVVLKKEAGHPAAKDLKFHPRPHLPYLDLAAKQADGTWILITDSKTPLRDGYTEGNLRGFRGKPGFLKEEPFNSVDSDRSIGTPTYYRFQTWNAFTGSTEQKQKPTFNFRDGKPIPLEIDYRYSQSREKNAVLPEGLEAELKEKLGTNPRIHTPCDIFTKVYDDASSKNGKKDQKPSHAK